MCLHYFKMAKKGGYTDFSESSNWNVASGFCEQKIMKPLYEADQYELLATFGALNLEEDFRVNEYNKTLVRVRGIDRLTKTLIMLCRNTLFALKSADKETVKGFLTELERIKGVLPFLSSAVTDQRVKGSKVVIKEEQFGKVLDILVKIKMDILEPLNKADLIFTSIEEFDPDKMKQELSEDIENAG